MKMASGNLAREQTIASRNLAEMAASNPPSQMQRSWNKHTSRTSTYYEDR